MPTYRAGEIADVLGVSIDTVRRWTDEGRLPTKRSRGGQRLIDGRSLARFVVEELSTSSSPRTASASTRNRLDGIVTAVIRDKVTTQVEMRCGPHRVVSLMTTEAADELGLESGVIVAATVKATNVAVEVLSRTRR
jgi:molybdopterin-binding protein